MPTKSADPDLEWHRSYRHDIYGRVGDAIVISFRDVLFKDASQPPRNACHENVARWLLENDGHFVLRGWLLEGEMPPFFQFAAHSVVQPESGEPFDITPLSAPHKFIRHTGTEADFQKALSFGPSFMWPEIPLEAFGIAPDERL